MIEPEVAFCDIYGDMDLAESFIKYIADTMLADESGDFEFFCKFVDKGLHDRLEEVSSKPFVRCSYTEAIEIMQASGEKFEYPPYWGMDLQSEHERFLTERPSALLPASQWSWITKWCEAPPPPPAPSGCMTCYQCVYFRNSTSGAVLTSMGLGTKEGK